MVRWSDGPMVLGSFGRERFPIGAHQSNQSNQFIVGIVSNHHRECATPARRPGVCLSVCLRVCDDDEDDVAKVCLHRRTS
jgi:hypothetical protein